ncbi:unnamed protein product [Didymodactylos carnosus]|uniref:Sushi domain-containing protein n=1 Tax=Didymodactylos carnosus TaxID=1234261 RepID=A0A813R2J7_9BILA|nr:unnamed protein product [Didymodactylos carnosus]CAF3560283.1 unnamed protein product [Didymodactylos carnosus]
MEVPYLSGVSRTVHGHLCPSVYVGSNLIFSCEEGFQLTNGKESLVVECLATGQWSEMPKCERIFYTTPMVRCSYPPYITNGFLTSYNVTIWQDQTYTGSVTYECDYGYKISTIDLVTECINGIWQNIPKCHVSLQYIRDPQEFVVDSYVLRFCNPNYVHVLSGPSLTIKCRKDGTWSGIPLCESLEITSTITTMLSTLISTSHTVSPITTTPVALFSVTHLNMTTSELPMTIPEVNNSAVIQAVELTSTINSALVQTSTTMSSTFPPESSVKNWDSNENLLSTRLINIIQEDTIININTTSELPMTTPEANSPIAIPAIELSSTINSSLAQTSTTTSTFPPESSMKNWDSNENLLSTRLINIIQENTVMNINTTSELPMITPEMTTLEIITPEITALEPNNPTVIQAVELSSTINSSLAQTSTTTSTFPPESSAKNWDSSENLLSTRLINIIQENTVMNINTTSELPTITPEITSLEPNNPTVIQAVELSSTINSALVQTSTTMSSTFPLESSVKNWDSNENLLSTRLINIIQEDTIININTTSELPVTTPEMTIPEANNPTAIPAVELSLTINSSLVQTSTTTSTFLPQSSAENWNSSENLLSSTRVINIIQEDTIININTTSELSVTTPKMTIPEASNLTVIPAVELSSTINSSLVQTSTTTSIFLSQSSAKNWDSSENLLSSTRLINTVQNDTVISVNSNPSPPNDYFTTDSNDQTNNITMVNDHVMCKKTDLPNVPNTRISFNNNQDDRFSIGSFLFYECTSGLESVVNRTQSFITYCLPDGSWSKTNLNLSMCRDENNTDKITDMIIDNVDTSPVTSTNMSINNGTSSLIEVLTTMLSNSPRRQILKPRCALPPPIDHDTTMIVASNIKVFNTSTNEAIPGSFIELNCLANASVWNSSSGSLNMTCLDTGKWTPKSVCYGPMKIECLNGRWGPRPRCKPAGCLNSTADTIPNGYKSAESYFVYNGQHYYLLSRYVCYNDSVMTNSSNGVADLKCHENKWPELPVCHLKVEETTTVE